MQHTTIRQFVPLSIFALCVAAGACNLVSPGGNQDDSFPTGPSPKLVAQASSGTFVSEVAYFEAGSESRFEVTIAGGIPGAQVEVVLNGLVVATIQLDESGNAEVEFRSSPENSGALPLPEAFVPPQAGDMVAVGDLQGTFEEDDDDGNSNDNGVDDDDDDGNNNANDNGADGMDDEQDNGNDNDSDDNGNTTDDGNDDAGNGNNNADDNVNDNVDDGDDDQSNDNSDVPDDEDDNMNDNTAEDDADNDNTDANDNTN